MTISWLNSKKCSISNPIGVAGTLLIAALGLGSSAFAAIPAGAPQSKRILAQIEGWKDQSFKTLIEEWKNSKSKDTLPTLLRISQDKSKKDQTRYIALMGAARLSGPAIFKEIPSTLKDRSWMIRSGGIRILRGMGSKDQAKLVYPLLKDSAWVVRTEAIELLSQRKPAGYQDQLVSVLNDSSNLMNGKAQVVSYRALDAILQGPYSPALKARLVNSTAAQKDVAFKSAIETKTRKN